MDYILDNEFAQIKGLKWLPWIGDDFLSQDVRDRLLIIGESHYHDNTQKSIDKHESPSFTRETVEEFAISGDYGETKIFQNLHRAFFRNSKFNTNHLWNVVAFCNIIQRPMNTNKRRPNYDDFYNGWKCFFEIIKLVEPKTCLFIGTSVANYLMDAIEETEYNSDGVKWDEYISNAYAKSAIITDAQNRATKFIFIRHTSQMFSWSNWNKYLQRVIPQELAFLEKKIKQNII